MQRFPVPQSENRAAPVAEQIGPKVRVPPPQPQREPRLVAPGLKPASERFMKRNPPVFEGTIDPTMAEEWVNMMKRSSSLFRSKTKKK